MKKMGLIGKVMSLLLAILMVSGNMVVPVHAFSSGEDISANADTVGDLWNSADNKLDETNVREFQEKMSLVMANGTYDDTSDDKAISQTKGINAKEIRAINGDKSVVVRIDGINWIVTYVSRAKDTMDANNDGKGDLIATLWLAGDETLVKSPFNDAQNPSTSVAQYPTNMYSSSKARSVLNGTPYVTDGSGSSMLQGEQNDKLSNLQTRIGNYIVEPEHIKWQEFHQTSVGLYEFDGLKYPFDSPNENWGRIYNVTDNQGSKILYDHGDDGYYFFTFPYTYDDTDMYKAYPFNYSVKTYAEDDPCRYDAWKNDKFWLPSMTEIGYKNCQVKSRDGMSYTKNTATEEIGIWRLSVGERASNSDTSDYYTRSGSPTTNNEVSFMSRNGEGTYIDKPHHSSAMRPGMHINLDAIAVSVPPYVPADSEGWEGVYDGNEHGIIVTVPDNVDNHIVSYGTEEGEYDLDKSPAISEVKDSPLTVYYKITAPGYADTFGEETVIINKADSAVTTVPTARTLSYSAESQELVTAGAAEGGQLQYSLDGVNYSADIPKKTEVGDYTVYYKVKGDDNHNDSEPATVDARIDDCRHKLTKVRAADPTCEKAGNSLYWKCDICNKVFLDKNGVAEIDEEDTVRKKLGHAYSSWEKLDAVYHQRVCARDKTHAQKAKHSWDKGKVTKKATASAAGVRTYTCTVCKATKTQAIPKLVPKVSGTLIGKMTAKGKTAVKISWTKVQGADGYEIYLTRCDYGGRELACQKVKTIKGNKTFKWTISVLRKNTSYKAYVKAYVMQDKEKTYVKTSPVVHAYTGNGTKYYTNARSVTVNKTTVTLKKGKTFKIKAAVNKVSKNKKLMPKGHAPAVRYMTSNSKIAAVSAGGKITAKGKGTCYIYAFAHNGVSKRVKVTVK